MGLTQIVNRRYAYLAQQVENMFYFPINKKKEFLGASFKIVLADCGLNKYNLNFLITYDIFRDLIGNCYQSDYCVKGMVE